MAELRQETHFLRDSLIANETIDLTTFDRVGRFGIDGKAVLCGAGETPQFIFMESASPDEPVSVAFIGMGQCKLSLSGSGAKGTKIQAGANGLIVAGSIPTAEGNEDDFGVALENWTDGDETEVFVYQWRAA